jgi:hypothetical protein
MGCLFVLFAAALPRLALVGMWLLGPWVDRAFGAFIWPLLGLVFLPITTLLYVIMWNTSGFGVDGWEWLLVACGVFLDLGSYGGGMFGRRSARAY